MDESKPLWFLENVDLKDFFCPNAIGQSHNSSESRSYVKGDFIYFQDATANSVFYVSSGKVKIGAYSKDGKEIIRAILHHGEVFGELGIVGETVRNEFAQAMEPVELCILSVELTKELMQKNESFCLSITRVLGDKLVQTQRRLEGLVFKDAKSRIVEFICDLAVEKGQRVGYEIVVRYFFTHQEIAHLTGTSRQTVTTVLNELRDENWIYFNRKQLLVRDLEKLKSNFL